MDKWMNEWMDGRVRMNDWILGSMNGGCMDEYTDV